jgi:hypothetical protein
MDEHKPLPPPTPAPLALDLMLTAMLGGVLVMLGALLVAGGPWLAYYTVHLWLPMWLLACAVFGGARLADRPGWMRRWLRVARGQFVEYGGGFYGAVALIAFAWLEWERLAGFIEFLASSPGVQGIVRQLIDFSIDSVLNGLWAFIWPAFFHKAFEMHDFWAALGLSAGVFGAAQALMRRLPAATR